MTSSEAILPYHVPNGSCQQSKNNNEVFKYTMVIQTDNADVPLREEGQLSGAVRASIWVKAFFDHGT